MLIKFKIACVTLSLLVVYLFVGVIETGSAPVNRSLCIKAPRHDTYIAIHAPGDNDAANDVRQYEAVDALNSSAGVLAPVLPLLLLQCFFTALFMHTRSPYRLRFLLVDSAFFFVSLLALAVVLLASVNVACFPEIIWLDAAILLGINYAINWRARRFVYTTFA